MGHLFGAFEEISAPNLPGNLAQLTRKRLKQAERDKELQCPNCRLRNLFLDDRRKRCADLYLPANLPRQFHRLFEPTRGALWINDVIAQKSSATIELEIEITAIIFGPRKKLDATIFPNFIKVFRSDTPNILILYLKHPMDTFLRIQQLY